MKEWENKSNFLYRGSPKLLIQKGKKQFQTR